MKNLVLCTLLTLGLLSVMAFYQDTHDYIYWDQRRILSWKDFKVKNQLAEGETAIAMTSCGFNYAILPNGHELRIHINTIVNKTKSWVKNGTQDDNGLRHEQGHFDIAEINARKLRNAVSHFPFKLYTYTHDFDSLYIFYDDLRNKEQERYDLETKHSNNKEQQAEWLKRIERELEEGKNYANPDMVVGLAEK